MDELVKESLNFLKTGAEQSDVFTLWEVAFAMGMSLACSLVIALVYRFTHRGSGYSQSYVQSLVLTSLVTTVIMIVIGSNIARAFSLVGALSIIRFRNAIKETRDVAFIFFAMAVAMANGTRFGSVAIIATLFICATMLVLHMSNFGRGDVNPERLLRVQLPPGLGPEKVIEPVLRKLFDSYSVVLVETVRQGLFTEVLYSVRPRPNLKPTTVIDELSKTNGNLKVSYSYGMHVEEV